MRLSNTAKYPKPLAEYSWAFLDPLAMPNIKQYYVGESTQCWPVVSLRHYVRCLQPSFMWMLGMLRCIIRSVCIHMCFLYSQLWYLWYLIRLIIYPFLVAAISMSILHIYTLVSQTINPAMAYRSPLSSATLPEAWLWDRKKDSLDQFIWID